MDNTTKFHTIQLFIWRSAEPDSIIEDIIEVGVAYVQIEKDIASEKLTLGTGKRVVLHAFDRAPTNHDVKELGKWDVVWELPPRCRRERPCVIVDGAPVDLTRFVRDRS